MTSEDLADLAFDLADEHASGLIYSCTVEEEIGGETWLSFGDGEQCRKVQDDCSNEIEYLEARGLLHRHPSRPELVRLEEWS